MSQLKIGDKVMATNIKTGETSPEPVKAVMVKRDTDLYNLNIKTATGSATIDTTRRHLFFDATRGRWIEAANLIAGDRLLTASYITAIVVNGQAPSDTTGWMWDISVPGGGDHDFYIDTVVAAVLVHNCEVGKITGYTRHGLNQAISHDGVGVSQQAINDAVRNPIKIVERANGTFRYYGKNAVVVMTSAGRVVTCWARNSAGWRA